MADSHKSGKPRPATGRPAPLPPPGKKPRKQPMSESDTKLDPEDSVFEVQRIRRLVELMKEHDLSEIDLRESRHRIRICRGPKEGPRVAYAPPPPPPPPPVHAAPQAAPAAKGAPAADSPNTVTIKSPMVGTYY